MPAPYPIAQSNKLDPSQETELFEIIFEEESLTELFFFTIFSYYDGFKSSVYFCKHQVDILTGNKVFLNDILYNQTALFYFMEVSLYS